MVSMDVRFDWTRNEAADAPADSQALTHTRR
jgi:hypothetical protein